MRRNVQINYSFTFLQFFVVTGLWVLYLSKQGFSAIEIGLFEAIFHGTSLLFEIPSGSFSDRFGYKRTLLFSRLLNCLSCLLIIMQPSFWGVALSFIFSALSYNLSSGTNEALLYESLRAEKQEKRYLSITAATYVWVELAASLGVILAGLFSQGWFTGVYWVQIVINLIAFILALGFTEPPKLTETVRLNFWQVLKQAYQTIKGIKGLAPVMIAFALTESLASIYVFYFQNYFEQLHIVGVGISIVLVISTIFQMLAAKASAWLGRKVTMRQLFTGVVLFVTCSMLGSALLNRWAVLICYILMNMMLACIFPILSDYINQRIPSKQRATINSVNSLCFSCVMIPCFPLIGWVVQQYTYRLAFLVLSACVLVGGLVARAYLHETKSE